MGARARRAVGRSSGPTPASCSSTATTVVGAHLAFYSERTIDGRSERFCNLGAWCVLPDHRFHSAAPAEGAARPGRLPLHRPLAERQRRRRSTQRLGFEFLDTTTALVPEPAVAVAARAGTRSAPTRRCIERTLTGARAASSTATTPARAAAHHVCSCAASDWCYVVFRKDRRKDLPLFASILHVSDPELFRAMSGPLARHLLLRHGAPATLVERARRRSTGRGCRSRSSRRGGRCSGARASRRLRSTTCTASWSASPGETGGPEEETPHDAHATPPDRRRLGAPSRRRPRAHVQGRDAHLRRAVGRGRRRSPPGCGELGLARGERVGDLPRQADRDRRRRSSAPRPPAASSCPSTRCCKAKQVAYILDDCSVRVLVTTAGALRAAARRAASSTAVEHVVVLGAAARGGRRPAAARLGGVRRRRRRDRGARRHRRRHGGDPLHLGQHRQAEGRRALAPQPARRRRERQPVPRQRRRTTSSSPRCR